jgi:phage terminase small subunit
VTPRTKRRGGLPLTAETPLSRRERAFVAEYLACFQPRRAALAVGYTGTAVDVTASKLLAKPHIAAAIEHGMTTRVQRLGIQADHVASDIREAANLDTTELFDARGNLLPIRQMPAHVRRAIVSVKVVKRNITAGDGHVDEVYEVKLIDKGKMHEILAKHTGLYREDGVQVQAPVPAFTLPAETPGVRVH